MSKLFIRCLYLVVWFMYHACEVYQDRPKIKTVDGDLVLEPAFDKSIYLRRNGPKSSVFVDGKDILNIKPKISSDGVASNANLDDLIKAQTDILKRITELETRTVPVPTEIYRNISSIWRRFDQINRRLITLNGHVSNHGRDQCSPNACANGATCIGLVESYICLCPSNWRGKNCDIDVDECRNFAGTELGCQNGATCINNPGSYECLCRQGWYGLHCTKKSKDCSSGDFEMCGHGSCVPVTTGDGIKCFCNQGWTTNGTDIACLTDINECESRYGPRCSINPRVDCVNLPGSFICGLCPPGYEGDGYTCSDIDECTVLPNGGCSPLVSCHNTIGSRICGSCPPGYQGDGVTCSFRGSCNMNHGGCHPSAHCIENMAFGTQTVQCFCPDGMDGDGVGLHGCYISNNNATGGCDNNPCGVHGQCHVLRSGYTCICRDGYGGSHCDTHTNTCTVNPCHNGGICRPDNSLSRGFRCECAAQYSGPLCQVMSKTCGGVLDAEEGSIVYPLSNTTYSHNSRCAWVIHTIPGKVVNVTFSKFNLEENSECLYDFLQIHDGRSSASQLIGRFCGNSYPKGGNIISSNNNLYFWFRSDSTVAKEGFALHWNTIDPVCGGELDASSHGHISSPGSPGKYPPNRDCYWHLSTTFGKRIQLHFFALDLEIHPNCSFDYLEIYDGLRKTDPLLNKFCNSSQPAPLTSAGSDMMIHFHSDAYGSGNGFQIVYAPVEGVPGCGGYFTTDRGELSSPSFNGSTLSNLLCEYKIKTDTGTKIRIDIVNFKLENSFQCKFDYLKIYDGPSSDSPLVGRFCGNSFPKYYVTSSNNLFIRFKTDYTVPSEGFKIIYRSLCHKTLHGDSGVLKSPGYPFSYPSNKECEYIINTEPGKAIQLTFQDFDIEDNRHYHCLYDYVEIRDGPDSNSTLLGKYCGGSDHIPPTQTSTNNYMYIKFSSDISISGTGFYANYTTIDTECGGIYRKTTGLINHPSDASVNYKNDQSCTWVLIAPEGMHIKLTWNRFEIEKMASCTGDYLELIELEDLNTNSSLGKFCGAKTPPALTTSSNRLMIIFNSDSNVRASGFSLSYTFLDQKSDCGGTFFKAHGFLYSPGWPKKYENNRDCTWSIIAPAGQQIKINISQFDLEKPIRDNCNHGDYLELKNGLSPAAPLIGQFCGSFKSKVIKSLGNAVFIHFHSDYYLTGKGFKLEWQGGLIGCGGTLTGSSGSLSSPNYPENYNENSECFYKIVTNLGSRVRLSFTDLDLERTTDCRDDYVEIFNGRDADASSLGKHCYMTPGLNNMETSSNYAFVKFRSDYYNQKQGFLLNYYTICNNNVTGRYGVIESPDYPNNYPLHSNCIWNINVPKGNKINITFTHFDILRHRGWWRSYRRFADCEEDYLQWKDNSDNVYSKKMCGSTIPSMITSKSNSLQIIFATGSLGSRTGFRLEWVSFGCGGHLQKESGFFIVDPRPSSEEIECEWLIESDIGKSVYLLITYLYVSVSVNCSTDAVEVYNGQDSKSPLLTKICNKGPTTIKSTANFMFIRFKKQSSIKGATLKALYNSVPATCGARIQAPSGYIYSHNYPKNYEDNLDCVWMIMVPQNHRILLNFVDLDLYSYNDIESETDCADNIKLFESFSLSNTSNYSYRICPHSNVTQITTKHNRIMLQFTTDNIGNAKGFKANFSVTCGEDIIATSDGIISRTEYIGGSNSSCLWTITANNSEQKVSLTITHLHLPQIGSTVRSNRSCQSSYLRVYDGNDVNAPLIDEYCGQKAPPMIISKGSTLTVALGSYDNSIVGQFSAHYSVLSTACGGKLTSEEGSIVSPNYPQAYPANADCEWELLTSPGNKVYVTFETFELEYSQGCNEDYLEIRANDGAGPLLGVYCGNDVPLNTTSGQKLYIKFHSNSENSGGGFVLHYGFIHGNDIVGLDQGAVSSPLYPNMYHGTGGFSWRIFTNGSSSITVTLDVLEIHSYSENCNSELSFYDGYDDTAPLLAKMCGILAANKKTIQSSSNLIYIHLNLDESNSGAIFHLKWTKSDKLININDDKKINCGFNNTVQIFPGNSTTIKSPNYPNEYNNDLNCEWVFKSTKGRHLSLRFRDFALEEVHKCFADYVNVFSSDTPDQWKPVMQNICEYNQINQNLTQASTYLRINFVTDSSVTRKGFLAIVKSECGGIITDLSGVVGPTWNDSRSSNYLNKLQCEWLVKVRTGRSINLRFIHFNITNKDDHCSNYVILRNGDSIESPLLSSGKYCGHSHEIREDIVTTSNTLHISYVSDSKLNNVFQTFKIFYEEKSVECGVTSTLDSDHSWEIISSPNYPSVPVPYSECIWKFSGPPGEILRIDFIDRFDLDYVLGCGNEVVEIRDGSSSFAPLKGQFCGEKPGTIKTTGNTMFIKYMTQLSVPRNGFKANISIDVCGGTIVDDSGEITSPSYPHYYALPYPSVCEWRIIGEPSHIINIMPKDIDLPDSESPCATRVTIEQPVPGNSTMLLLKSFCRSQPDYNPSPIASLSNEVVIKFHIEKPGLWSQGTEDRGFRFTFNSTKPSCGGRISTSEGYLITPGYPIETTIRFCQWIISIPDRSRRVRLELLDTDISKQEILIANDPTLSSLIESTARSSNGLTANVFESSSYHLTVFIMLKPLFSKHKFKASFSSNEQAICGGQLRGLNGTIISPNLDRSYYCEWRYRAENNDHYNNNKYIYKSVFVTLQFNSSSTKSRCQLRDSKLLIKTPFNMHRFGFSRSICSNIEESYRIPSPSLELRSNRNKKDYISFKLTWKAQPCGGNVEVGNEPINILDLPQAYNDTLDCAWMVKVPYGNRVDIELVGSFNYDCDDEFIKIYSGFSQYAPVTGQYCKTKPLEQPLNVNFRYIYVEYHTKQMLSNNIKLMISKSNQGKTCGGDLTGYRYMFESPNYPKNYNANSECTWTITANIGNRVSLEFVQRFVIEDTPNCTKDSLIIYDWKNENYNEIAKICGRLRPLPYNSTFNKMKVTFRTDEATNMEGFKAIWKPICGGTFIATEKEQFLYSPGFPYDYSPSSNCSYEIIAPKDKTVLIQFLEFGLEGNRPECAFDNLTISANTDYRYFFEVYCGNDVPPAINNFNKVSLIFKSDGYIERKGFKLSYTIYDCNGKVTEPTVLSSNINNNYEDNMNCTWEIEAPSNKIVVFKFLYIDLETHYECYNDYVAVYEDLYIDDDKRLALLCGHVNSTTIVRAKGNKALINFASDHSYNFKGFKVQVIFTYSETIGCGGHIDLTSSSGKTLKSFLLNNNAVYENYLDCLWTISSAVDTVIKVEFTAFHISPCRDVNQTAIGYSKCNCDMVEIKDGINPDSLTIGTYCGHTLPPPISSSGNLITIRLSTDGEIVSSGFEVKLKAEQSLCGRSHFTLSDKSINIKSPGFINGQIPRPIHCIYYIDASSNINSQIRISFLTLDLLMGSDIKLNKCDRDKLVITESPSSRNMSYGKDLILNFNTDTFLSNFYYDEIPMPNNFEMCGTKKPSDLYVTGNLAISLVTAPEIDTVTYKGIEIEIGFAGFCGRNYTDTQGKIQSMHNAQSSEENTCYTLITAPENHTISAYFITVTPDYWNSNCYLEIFDGNNTKSPLLVKMSQDYENVYPVFSTGRYMLLHNNQDNGDHLTFDMNFVTTDKGRGCGGKIMNEFGRVTSPMYPDIYRNKSSCEWEIETPLSTKLKLHFTVFDLGHSCDQNYLQLVNSNGVVISSYCSESLADYTSPDNYVKIVFFTTKNNGGTGWVADFYGIVPTV